MKVISYIGLGVGCCAVVGLLLWYIGGVRSRTTTDQSVQGMSATSSLPMVTASDTITGHDTLVSLLKLNKSLECTFQFKDSAIRGEGTGFFDGQKMRIDSMYQGDTNVVYTSNLIISDTDMYVWAKTEAGEFAFKMARPEDMSAQTTPTNNGQLRPQDPVNYSCKPWHVDGSVFVPPTNLTFMNMGDMLNQMKGAANTFTTTRNVP